MGEVGSIKNMSWSTTEDRVFRRGPHGNDRTFRMTSSLSDFSLLLLLLFINLCLWQRIKQPKPIHCTFSHEKSNGDATVKAVVRRNGFSLVSGPLDFNPMIKESQLRYKVIIKEFCYCTIDEIEQSNSFKCRNCIIQSLYIVTFLL